MTEASTHRQVLVTGAGGFSAQQIIRELTGRGHKVSALFRSEESANKANLPEGTTATICDLSEGTEGLARSYDAVVHTAANAPPRPSVPSLLYRDNIVATKNLLDHLTAGGSGKLIFFSSLSVYGQIQADVVDEETEIRNPDPYGQSKLFCEEMIREVEGTLPSVSLRLPGLIGTGLVVTGAGPFLARALRSFRAGEDVSAFNPDARFNNALDVVDLARFTADLVERDLEGASTLTLASAGMTRVRDALKILEVGSSANGLLRIVPGVKPSFTISIDRAVGNFSFSPKTIEQALTEFAKQG